MTEYLPRSLQFRIVKIRVRIKTVQRYFAIRKAYGASLNIYPKAAVLLGAIALFILFGFFLDARFKGHYRKAAVVSVPSRSVSERLGIAKEQSKSIVRKIEKEMRPDKKRESIPYAFLVDKNHHPEN